MVEDVEALLKYQVRTVTSRSRGDDVTIAVYKRLYSRIWPIQSHKDLKRTDKNVVNGKSLLFD